MEEPKIKRIETDAVVVDQEVRYTFDSINPICQELPTEIEREIERHQEHIRHLQERLFYYRELQQVL